MKRLIKEVLLRAGYRLSRLDTTEFLEFLLYRQLHRTKSFFFVQVGANDGITSDPIRPFVVRNRDRVGGIVLEPLPDVFEELKRNYRKFPQVLPLNYAVHNSEREMTLYRVDPERAEMLPSWAKGIASFRREHHTLSGIPPDCIRSVAVPCLTLAELVELHQIRRIDLLQIDTEGYDAEILLGLDFRMVRPVIISFEHGRFDDVMEEEVFERVLDRLHEEKYEILLEPYDAVAYQRDLLLTPCAHGRDSA